MLRGPYAALFWGRLCANTGVWMHNVVAAVVVFGATGSAVAVGLVSVAQFTPQLLLGPLCGSWADRGRPVRQLVLGRALCVAGAAGLALALLAGPTPDGVFTAVLVSSVLVGIGFAIDGPAMQTLVPDLVPSGRLRTVMLLNTLPTTLGRLLGPLAAAIAVAYMSAPVAFMASAALHLVMLLMVSTIRRPASASAQRSTAATGVVEAVRYLRTKPVLVLALLGTVAVGAGCEPTLTLAPSMASRLEGGEQLVGYLGSAFGAGALAGVALLSVSSRWMSVRTSACGGLLCIAAGCSLAGLIAAVGSSLAGASALALVAFALTGVGFSAGMAGFSTLLQHHTATQYRGRVMAWWMVAFVGSRPVAAIVIGLVADVTEVWVGFVGAAAVVLAVSWLSRPSRLLTKPGEPAR